MAEPREADSGSTAPRQFGIHVDLVNEWADRMVATGVPRTRAIAIACWVRHSVDDAKIDRDLAERAERFERAAEAANEYAFARGARERLTADDLRLLEARSRPLRDFERLAKSIERDLGKPDTFEIQGETHAWDQVADIRTSLNRARHDHEMGLPSVGLDMWAVAVELQSHAVSIRLHQRSRDRGRPGARRLKALCAAAQDKGLTAKQLAEVGVTETHLANDLVQRDRPKWNTEAEIEKLRQRLQRHWPTAKRR